MIPQKYRDYVGRNISCSGKLFSKHKELPVEEYTVLGIRWGNATIFNLETEVENPTYQLLLKSKTMKRSRWTRNNKIKEIEIRNGEHIEVGNDLQDR